MNGALPIVSRWPLSLRCCVTVSWLGRLCRKRLAWCTRGVIARRVSRKISHWDHQLEGFLCPALPWKTPLPAVQNAIEIWDPQLQPMPLCLLPSWEGSPPMKLCVPTGAKPKKLRKFCSREAWFGVCYRSVPSFIWENLSRNVVRRNVSCQKAQNGFKTPRILYWGFAKLSANACVAFNGVWNQHQNFSGWYLRSNQISNGWFFVLGWGWKIHFCTGLFLKNCFMSIPALRILSSPCGIAIYDMVLSECFQLIDRLMFYKHCF